MVASERRFVEEAEAVDAAAAAAAAVDGSALSQLPDGRIVFRPQKYWYLMPLLAAVVFVSISILVVRMRE